MAEPKTGKWRLILVGAVMPAAIAGAGTWWAKSVLRDSTIAYEQDIARSEKEYVTRLDTWLARPDDPRDSIDPTEEIEPRVQFKLPLIGDITIRPKFRLPETRMTLIKLPPRLRRAGTCG